MKSADPMTCPTCGKTLRVLQVKKMLGNPAYNEWCRSGYRSNLSFWTRHQLSYKQSEHKP